MQSVSTRRLLIVALSLGLLVLLGRRIFSDEEPLSPPQPTYSQPGEVTATGGAEESGPGTRSARSQEPQKESPPDLGRAELSAAVSAARASRHSKMASAPHAVSPGAAEQPSSALSIANKTGSNHEWEQRQLETLNQLLGECYELASAEQPGLAGTIGIRFTVAGEPDIGGLVNEIEFIPEASSIDHPGMRECMQESMYALELDPPPEGIKVGREVTLRLEPDEDE